jgi:hypothetical protein
VKKIIALCLLSIPFLVYTQGFDVRKTRWEMTQSQIIAAEGRQPLSVGEGFDNDYVLDYEIYIDSRKVLCSYHLLNGRLSKVTYRYYWGNWQKDSPKTFNTRTSSFASLFSSLNKRGFALSTGWYIMNEKYSAIGKQLIKCLGIFQREKPFANLEIVENCFNGILNSYPKSAIGYAKIRYENSRTQLTLSYPLQNHQFKNEILGWVVFESKSYNKYNQSDF